MVFLCIMQWLVDRSAVIRFAPLSTTQRQHKHLQHEQPDIALLPSEKIWLFAQVCYN